MWVSLRAWLRSVLASPDVIPSVHQEEGWEIGSFPSPFLLLQTAEEPQGQIVHRGARTSSLQDPGLRAGAFPLSLSRQADGRRAQVCRSSVP